MARGCDLQKTKSGGNGIVDVVVVDNFVFCCSMGEIMIHDHLSCHPTRFGRRHLLQTSFDCAQLPWLARQGFDLLQRSDGCRCGRAARLVPKGRTTKVDTLDGLTVSDDRHSLQVGHSFVFNWHGTGQISSPNSRRWPAGSSE